MNNKRLFISLPIDPGLVKYLIRGFNQLDIPKDILRISPSANYHLTIKFLGDTPIDKLMDIINIVKPVVSGFGSFEINIDQPKIFPIDKTKQPRGLTIGIQPNEKLQELFNQVEDALWQAGLANKEMRRFTPHITVARVKQAANYNDFEDFINWPVKGAWGVDYLQLQESILKKTGPEYIALETFDL